MYIGSWEQIILFPIYFICSTCFIRRTRKYQGLTENEEVGLPIFLKFGTLVDILSLISYKYPGTYPGPSTEQALNK